MDSKFHIMQVDYLDQTSDEPFALTSAHDLSWQVCHGPADPLASLGCRQWLVWGLQHHGAPSRTWFDEPRGIAGSRIYISDYHHMACNLAASESHIQPDSQATPNDEI